MRRFPSVLFLVGAVWAAPSPELPGIDVRDLGPAWGDTVTRMQGADRRETGRGIGRWAAPPPEVQLEADEVLLGMGEGAVFVPSMTHGRLEPRVSVADSSGRFVSIGPSGRRLRLKPGAYKLSVGSGSEDQRMEIPVEVRDGETTVAPASWSGLTIATISVDRQHFRGEYKLVRQDRFQSYGDGFGQTEDRLSDLPTWILPPGVYKITGLASGADDLTNFVTVRLLPGEWTEFTLVMDGDKVVGGGTITQAATESRREDWLFGADLGGSVSWTREKLSRQANIRTTTNLAGYTQLRLRREKDAWLTTSRLQFVGGATKTGEDNWKIAPDEVVAQVFAVRRVTPRVGPYGRLVGTSHLLPSDIDLSTTSSVPLLLFVRDPESGRLERRVPGGASWEVASSFAPLELRQGLGLNVEAVQTRPLEISLQAGLASRQVFPFGAYYQKSLDNPGLLQELRGVDSNANVLNSVVMQRAVFDHGTGLEATAELRARLGSSASLASSPGLFWSLWPRDQLEFSMLTVLSLHLTRFASVDYRYAIKKSVDEGAIHRYPYSHQVLLRFSFGS